MDDDADDPPGLARIELAEGEERTLRRLAAAMGIVGVVQIVIYGIALTWMLVALAQSLGFALRAGAVGLAVLVFSLAYVALPIWQGVMVREAGEAFGRVGGPDADDQEFLASAFRRLKVVFVIELLVALWHLKDTFG